jgi:hypothetical protein
MSETKHTPAPWMWEGAVAVPDDPARLDVDRLVSALGERVAYPLAGWDLRDLGIRIGVVDAGLIKSAPDMFAALVEIAKGEGPFSREPLEHAANTIEAMKTLAVAAINKAGGR